MGCGRLGHAGRHCGCARLARRVGQRQRPVGLPDSDSGGRRGAACAVIRPHDAGRGLGPALWSDRAVTLARAGTGLGDRRSDDDLRVARSAPDAEPPRPVPAVRRRARTGLAGICAPAAAAACRSAVAAAAGGTGCAAGLGGLGVVAPVARLQRRHRAARPHRPRSDDLRADQAAPGQRRVPRSGAELGRRPTAPAPVARHRQGDAVLQPRHRIGDLGRRQPGVRHPVPVRGRQRATLAAGPGRVLCRSAWSGRRATAQPIEAGHTRMTMNLLNPLLPRRDARLRRRIAAGLLLLLPGLALGQLAPAQSAAEAADLVREHSHVFSFDVHSLRGPGADFLRRHTADTQFVLFGEDHLDHLVPLFAQALYTLLHDAHGYRHLVVEQDPVAIEDALAPGRRGDAAGLARHAGAYPTLYEFDTDEDLGLLAAVGRLQAGPDAIWGIEQCTGAVRYLEELLGMAPDAAARAQASALLAHAREADGGPGYKVEFLAETGTPAALARLSTAYATAPDSRAGRLLRRLSRSAEIFGYYRRAEAGERVGLFNNTVREEEFKDNFLRRYRAAAAGGGLPRAMFKMGANHLYHGKNPTHAFPIGNLAHELALVNGSSAYGLYVQPLGRDYVRYTDLPDWLRPLLPATEPSQPTLVDLRSLRRHQSLFSAGVAAAQIWRQRALLHGYEALVLLPNSRPGVRSGRGLTPVEPGR